MKSAVESLNPTRVKLSVEVPYDELKPSLDAAYKTIANQVTVPGFRKGHVPPRIIDQRVGRGAVIEEAVNEALPQFYAQAVQESDVRPLGRPTVDVTEVPDTKAGGELRFTAEVDVRPQLDLPELDGIEVAVDDVEVTDDDVAEQVDTLRERFGTLLGVDRPVADGDFVSLDITATIDGEEIDSVTGVSYQVGSGQMLEGMDGAITGRSAGDTATFTAPLAGGDRAGQDADVTVTVQSVKERSLPPLDNDFAELASEFDTLEELREDLREKAAGVKRLQQGLQARERLLEHLLEVVEIPVPESLVEEEVHRHLENEDRLEDAEHRAEVTVEAQRALRSQLLLDTIAELREVSVEQGELVEYLVASAQQYGMEPAAFAKAVDEAGQVPAMVAEVARRKALATVLETAVIKDASGEVIDLDSLFPRDEDDELADPSLDPDAGPDAVTQDDEAARGVGGQTPAAPSAADPAAVRPFDLGGFEPSEPVGGTPSDRA